MPNTLAATFNFRVTLNRSAGDAGQPAQLGDGAFQECSGLQIEMDVQEWQVGGRNDGVARRIGRGKYTNIVLKRGLLYPTGGTVNNAMWAWMQAILTGVRPVTRYDGVIQVLSASGRDVVATWTFQRGLPQRLVGPTLNAKTGEVAIEELTIAHEGLKLRL